MFSISKCCWYFFKIIFGPAIFGDVNLKIFQDLNWIWFSYPVNKRHCFVKQLTVIPGKPCDASQTEVRHIHWTFSTMEIGAASFNVIGARDQRAIVWPDQLATSRQSQRNLFQSNQADLVNDQLSRIGFKMDGCCFFIDKIPSNRVNHDFAWVTQYLFSWKDADKFRS